MAKWQPGQSGNPGGKPVGARNKLQGDFLTTLASDFEAHGAKAIERCRIEKPDVYVRTIASLMPRELELKRPTEELTDDELAAALAALRSLVVAQAAGTGSGDSAAPAEAGAVPTLQ